MRKILASVAIVGLVVLAGCNTSQTGGGTPAEGTFKLKGPETSTTVKHGSTEKVKVNISKEKGFKEDITFTATVDKGADKGLKVDVEPKHWKASDPTEVTVSVSADDKTAAGDYKVHLIGKPAKGTQTDVFLDVKVPEKK